MRRWDARRELHTDRKTPLTWGLYQGGGADVGAHPLAHGQCGLRKQEDEMQGKESLGSQRWPRGHQVTPRSLRRKPEGKLTRAAENHRRCRCHAGLSVLAQCESVAIRKAGGRERRVWARGGSITHRAHWGGLGRHTSARGGPAALVSRGRWAAVASCSGCCCYEKRDHSAASPKSSPAAFSKGRPAWDSLSPSIAGLRKLTRSRLPRSCLLHGHGFQSHGCTTQAAPVGRVWGLGSSRPTQPQARPQHRVLLPGYASRRRGKQLNHLSHPCAGLEWGPTPSREQVRPRDPHHTDGGWAAWRGGARPRGLVEVTPGAHAAWLEGPAGTCGGWKTLHAHQSLQRKTGRGQQAVHDLHDPFLSFLSKASPTRPLLPLPSLDSVDDDLLPPSEGAPSEADSQVVSTEAGEGVWSCFLRLPKETMTSFPGSLSLALLLSDHHGASRADTSKRDSERLRGLQARPPNGTPPACGRPSFWRLPTVTPWHLPGDPATVRPAR
ncbi:uncharacterized protein ACOB8E_021741 [Sarcophilus harrisii]